MTTTVIVGASVAGVHTALALRSEGHRGDIVLVGDEEELPYDKPPLSKALLAGIVSPESIRLLTKEAADASGIRLMLGHRAVRVDTGARVVEFLEKPPLRYDHLVVATGARARPSPWGDGPGIHVLRTLRDALALRRDLLQGGHVVVIGGGFIGAEVASTARALGMEVTIVDPLSAPMARVLGAEVGGWFTDLHHRHGVGTRFGTGVEAIRGERGQFTVELTDGSRLTADSVVVGIGAQPNDEWLRSSGFTVNDGLVCDQYLGARGAEGVFGVGDVARWSDAGTGEERRFEHWTNAVEQAACVAHNIAHPQDMRGFAPTEYVWSDEHDWKIQLLGDTRGLSPHAVVGDPQRDTRFATLYSHDARTVSGAMVVNWPRAFTTCRKAIRSRLSLTEVLDQIGGLAGT